MNVYAGSYIAITGDGYVCLETMFVLAENQEQAVTELERTGRMKFPLAKAVLANCTSRTAQEAIDHFKEREDENRIFGKSA